MNMHQLVPSFSFLRPILPATILLLGLGLAHPAQAAITYFVDPAGQNTNTCLAAGAGTACRTITHVLLSKPLVDGDTISIATGIYNGVLGEIFPLTIKNSLMLTGAGAGSTFLDAKGVNQRVIFISSGKTVTISGVFITDGTSDPIGPSGSGPGGGGGIRNDGTLHLNNSTVSNNSGGGGIFNSGTMTLTNSTVSNNIDAGGIFNLGTLTLNNSTVSRNDGGNSTGGIYNFFGTLTLNNSTVSGNTGGGAGGIRNTGGPMTLNNSTVSGNKATHNITGGIYNDCVTVNNITTAVLNNSTVSGNSAVSYGGGIVNNGDGCRATITLNNSTVTGNIAGGDGGGIMQDPRNTSGTITLKNTIVAGNTSLTNNSRADCAGVITTQGHNLFGVNTGCPISITDITVTNPDLDPLTSNGGPTQTHLPLLSSAAVNAVPPVNCTIAADQRGITRPQGAACDIGSVELQMQMFEYSVKFVCGRALATTPIAPHPVAPGTYYTAINVHNPNTGTINFIKKFARALPNQQAGTVTQFFPATLKADQAFEVECAEITSKLGLPQLTLVTGFAVFQSAQELDIVAVYSAATTPTGPVVTMHTERVPKRP